MPGMQIGPTRPFTPWFVDAWPLVSRRCLLLTAVAIGIGICGTGVRTSRAQLPNAQLRSIFPPGGQRGSALDVRVAGVDLDDATRLIFSHPQLSASVKRRESEFEGTQPIPGRFRVTIGEDVPCGVYEARVVGRFGVSNPRAFAVGRYGEATEPGDNSTLESAFPVELDQIVNGVVERERRDYFRVFLRAGQRMMVECAAQRIDSRLDGSLTLLNDEGTELLRNHSYRGPDPFLDFTAPLEGDYYIALYDFLYRGGADYSYRLTVHSGPHLDFVFPPSALAGTDPPLTLFGRNLPGGQPTPWLLHGVNLEQLTVNVPLPSSGSLSRQLSFASVVEPATSMLDSVTYRYRSDHPIPIFVAETEVLTEREPNDSPDVSQQTKVPAEVVGQLFPAHDVDCVRFDARKGDVVFVELLSHRLGLDVDPRFVVEKVTRGEGGQESLKGIADVDDPSDRNRRIGLDYDTSTDDPSFKLVVDEDATYQVTVWDQQGDVDDPRRVYRLVIREPKPDYRLVVVPLAPESPENGNTVRMGTACVRRGGTAAFRVLASRSDGFAGDIQLKVEGLPAGVGCRGGLIRASTDQTDLIFEADEEAPSWTGAIQVVGKAQLGGQRVERRARGGVAVWGSGNRQQDPPTFRATHDIVLAVVDELAPAAVQVHSKTSWVTSKGGQLDIPISITRRRNFSGDLKLVCHHLPKQLKPKDLTVKGDVTEAKLSVAVTNSRVKPGLYSFFLRADSTAKLARDPDAVRRAEQAHTELANAVKQLEAAIAQSPPSDSPAQCSPDEARTRLERAREVQAMLTKRVENAKKANAPKATKFVTISPPIQLKIVDSPLSLSVKEPAEEVLQGQTVELLVHVERDYGFTGEVTIVGEAPKGTKGLALGKATLEKGASKARLELAVADNAPPGSHRLTVRAHAKFNKIEVQTVHHLEFSVKAKAAKSD